MKIIQPEIEEIYSYIIQTHKADHIDVTKEHIKFALGQIQVQKGERALEGVEKSCCIGHFKAINYTIQLAGSFDFPAKEGSNLDNEFSSNQALNWLREIHSLMMYPIAEYGLKNGTGQLYIQNSQCGTYRYTPKQLAYSPAPAPELIPKILHLWLVDINTLDLEIKDKVDNPYGLTTAQSQEMYRKVKEITPFISCLQPFEDGNNRVAKLVENAFRLRWRLPWRTIHQLELETLNRDLTAYQEKPDGFMRWVRLAAAR